MTTRFQLASKIKSIVLRHKIIFTILAVVLSLYAFDKVTSLFVPGSFVAETKRINYPAKPISVGWIKDCGDGATFGPSLGQVCAGRYQEIFKSTGDLCNDFSVMDSTLKRAGYKYEFHTPYQFDIAYEQSGSKDICEQLKYSDTHVMEAKLIDIITYSYNQDVIDTGTFYIQCQIGTKRNPYNLDQGTNIRLHPADFDRSAVYGCALQHNF